jgi:hypothetical protein
MKGFKPTGYGPSSGFVFPTRMGFTGSTGKFTTVAPYTRRKFADGGFVRQDNPRMQTGTLDEGSALVRRGRATNDLDQESGGKTPIRPGFKNGGNWIAGATKNKGALHRALHVPEGKKIPAKKLAKAARSNNPMMRKRAALAKTLKAMRKADGGDVRLPRRKTPYTFGESVRAIPEALKEAMRAIGSSSSGMAKKAADSISGRQKQIDDYIDSAESGSERTASNYARGGKMKRMGYAQGGLARMMGEMMRRRQQAAPAMMRAPPMVMRSSGGKAKRMGYANGGSRRDGMVTTERPSPAPPKKSPPPKAPDKPYPPAAMIKEKFYAKGGGVSAGQAKKIAERTVGEHVRYPAPKGHKGLEKAMRR